MRSETRLDSAVFQLTPTRTRCDLVIISNGKTEKLASGLVNPFISHLKIAQDQIARGGYSIKLEPESSVEASWFTKGTVQRFVRFVSTPDVLERVNNIELEILQIEKAILIQGNEIFGLSTVEEHHQLKSNESIEGKKQISDADSDKAIILYKPGPHSNLPESNGSKVHEENSKVQLLRVLESRIKVLQKEQAMAFACTAAAGFDIESMTHLKSFAESFGASRLREACLHHMQLWKRKHESGQWIEIEAAEVMSYRPEFPSVNSPDIVLSGDAVRQRESTEGWPLSSLDQSTVINGNAVSQDSEKEKRLASEPHKYYHGPLQHPSFPQWIHPHPMQPMPYYQNYPTNGQFFYPPQARMDDPTIHTSKKKMKKRHSMKNDQNSESENGSGETASESEEESVKSHSSHHGKHGRSRTNKGVVVIRNLNYIAGKRQEVPGNVSESTDDSEMEEIKDLKSSKLREFNTNSTEILNGHGKGEENWLAFQNFLLTAEDKMISASERGLSNGGHDHILLTERDFSSSQKQSIADYDSTISERSRIVRAISADEFIASSAIQFNEAEKVVPDYQKTLSDTLVEFEHKRADNFKKGARQELSDESFMIPLRSGWQDVFGLERKLTIESESEFRRNENSGIKAPDDLALLIGRTRESESIGYNTAINCDIQVLPITKHESKKEEETSAKINGGSMKIGGEKKTKSHQTGSEKKKKDAAPTAKLPSSKSTSLNEAQKRAEKLRNYKSDLQKLKKEQEAGEMRRLEALKCERKKRIASRNGSTKLTPNSLKTSKFTDSEPGSNPALLKLPINANKASKAPKPDRLSRSAPPLLDAKKERPKQAASAASERIRRLSEPKVHIKTKSGKTDQVNKKPLFEQPQSKKISAIIQLDRTKSETLPELKIKTCRTPAEVSAISESVRCDSKVEKNIIFSSNDVNPVIEKSAGMLENEAVFTKTVSVIEGKIDLKDKVNCGAKLGMTGMSTDYTDFRTLPIREVEIKDMAEGGNQRDDHLHTNEDKSKTLLHFSAHEKSRALSATIDTTLSNVSSIDQKDESQEKMRNNELKGLKKLWKFGRKVYESGSSDTSLDSNSPVIYDHLAANSPPSNASTLKSLISQDETNAIGGASAKVSRHFSILSPFRGKKVAV